MRELLANKQSVATTEHVVREWKRILVASTDAVLAAVEDEEDLVGMFAALAQGFGRQASQRLRALALCAGPSSQSLDRVEIRVRARSILRIEIDRLFDEVTRNVRDPSACPLALERPVEDKSGRWAVQATCRRGETTCVREERLSDEIGRWDAGANALVSSEVAGYVSQGRTAVAMSKDPKVRTGKNCYASTGDIGIALDALPGEEIVSTDASFAVLAPAMNCSAIIVQTRRAP